MNLGGKNRFVNRLGKFLFVDFRLHFGGLVARVIQEAQRSLSMGTEVDSPIVAVVARTAYSVAGFTG